MFWESANYWLRSSPRVIDVLVKYDHSVLKRFKERARKRAPLEYLELLFGHITDDHIEILQSVPVKHTATLSTSNDQSIEELDEGDVATIKLKQAADGLEWVGDIHSHPGHDDNVPSETDNESALKDKAALFGIYSFHFSTKSGRCSSQICFYTPQRPILLERAA